MLKNVQGTQATIMRARKENSEEERQAWHAEKQALKDEKKKLEHAVFDLLKARAVDKEKIKRIRAICDE